MKKSDTHVNMFGLDIFSSTREVLLSELESNLGNSRKLSYIFTPNPEQVVLTRGNKQFLQALNEADWLLPDGYGLVWASWLFSLVGRGQKLRERIAGREVVENLLELAADQNYRVLVIGGQGYDNIDGLSQAEIRWTPGYENVKHPKRVEHERLHDLVADFKPDIVFVAFGAPHQELWAVSHREMLDKAGVRLVMSVGGAFDYLLGKVPQVPSLVGKLGFEWLFRLITQPWRIWRQLRLIKFVFLTLREIAL